jgi:phosphoethanolamine N-methyltransferase
VLRYERIFGKNFVSTGGIDTTREFCKLLKLEKGKKVLDVGCGIGGSAFYMATTYGVDVHGVDLSNNMINIALEKLEKENIPKDVTINFEICDATKKEFEKETFDVIYSRDTILHIYDKVALFKRFYDWLKPNGVLFITDYCVGPKPHSKEFEEYVKQRRYHLLTPEQYGKAIEVAGFEKVETYDETKRFIEILKDELKRFEVIKDDFTKEFSETDYNHIIEGWESKVVRCNKGDQRWGRFIAYKK